METGATMKVSVVICTFNRNKDCRATVESVLHQIDAHPYEIIVVDDFSKIPFGFDHDGVRIIRNSENQGASASRNIGAKASRGDLVCFIDDDTPADPNWIKNILIAISNGADIVGGEAEPLYSVPPPKWWSPNLFGFFVGINNRDILTGNLAVRRNVFNEIGYFNEELGRKGAELVSCEDIEFRERARAAGLNLVFDQNIKVYHKVLPRRLKIDYLVRRTWGQGITQSILNKRKDKSIPASVFAISRRNFRVLIEAIRQKAIMFPVIVGIAFFLKTAFWFSVFYTSHFTTLR